MNALLEKSAKTQWRLEGFVDGGESLRRLEINGSPLQVGRSPNLALSVANNTVSKLHAELRVEDGQLWVRDLNSTNGTFINGQRLEQPARLQSGDLVHFAGVEFRVDCHSAADMHATQQVDPTQWVWALSQFDKLFEPGAAVPFYQPIVRLPHGEVTGYEVLARSQIDGLQTPQSMFEVAEQLRLEGELSRLFRRLGVEQAQPLPLGRDLFLNTHPAEMHQPELLKSLAELRKQIPRQRLVLEIHEAAASNPAAMRELRQALADLEIGLAYDDFGAGQARLVDLVEAPPDFLKFDISMIRDLDTAPPPRVQMLSSLIRMAHDLGVCVLAEGIERLEESQVCTELGFELAQGYFFGRPAAVGSLAECQLL